MLTGCEPVVHRRLALINLRSGSRHLGDEVRAELVAFSTEEHIHVRVAAATGGWRSRCDPSLPAGIGQDSPTAFPDLLLLFRSNLGRVPGDSHRVHEYGVPDTLFLHLRANAR